jgi:hypothetical protein
MTQFESDFWPSWPLDIPQAVATLIPTAEITPQNTIRPSRIRSFSERELIGESILGWLSRISEEVCCASLIHGHFRRLHRDICSVELQALAVIFPSNLGDLPHINPSESAYYGLSKQTSFLHLAS